MHSYGTLCSEKSFHVCQKEKKSSIHVLQDNLFFELGQVLSRFLEPHSGGFVPISHSCLKVLWEITGILELFVCFCRSY